MIVKVGTDGTVRMLEAEDLRRFSVAMPDTDAARAALASVARLDGRDHAWFAPGRVRALAGRTLAGQVPAGWDEQFAATMTYATTKGWTDADGALRAHIVYDGPQA